MKIWTQQEEAENLAKRFADVNRAEFARDYSIKGGASIIYQHITARRPISLYAAQIYAFAFKCKLEDISPRLALEAKTAISFSAFGDRTRQEANALDMATDESETKMAYVLQKDEVRIPQYDVAGSMGRGLILDGMAGEIRGWNVDHEWLRLNVRHHTGVKNLCIVTGFGPSMKPLFNPGDPLLLDRGVKTFDHEDTIYFFRVGNYGFIKTVQRIPKMDGGTIYRAKSKNPDYDPFDIVDGMDFEVFGKVLTVWKSEQY